MLRKRGLCETIKRPLTDYRLKEIITTNLPKPLELWLVNKLVSIIQSSLKKRVMLKVILSKSCKGSQDEER